MTSGSGPISDRLAAYRAAQPPRTENRAAMPDNVSPCCTTYLAPGRAAVSLAAAVVPSATTALSLLVRVTSVLLLAMRIFAWAGRASPVVPAATAMISRMLQANTTHADFVHACTVLSLSFRGISAGRCWPGRREA